MIRALFVLGFLISRPAMAQSPCEGGLCVAKEDIKAFVELAKEKKCLQTETPTFELDPVHIVVDRQGRIFFSGEAPTPYKLKMRWCTYDVEAEGKVTVHAAVQEPPTLGFRFRPKAYLGYLLAEPFREGKDAKSGMDAGLMIDAFYWREMNLNVHAGFRAVGVGVGVDIFRSFGAYAGYALSWDMTHNPEASLWFAFW